MRVTSIEQALVEVMDAEFPIVIKGTSSDGDSEAYIVDNIKEFIDRIKVVLEQFDEVDIANMVLRSDVDELIADMIADKKPT